MRPIFDVMTRGRLSVLAFRQAPLLADPRSLGRVLDVVRSLCRVMPLAEAVTALRAGMLPPRAACITFDGADPDWLPGVVTLLQSLDLHATFFVAAGHAPGQPVESVRAIRTAGLGVGCLAASNAILTRCAPDEAMREIGRAREQLRDLVGAPVDGFAYPGGVPGQDFTAQHVDLVRRAGYRFAVTTGPGVARGGQSMFQIPRFTPDKSSLRGLAWQLARNARGPVQMLAEETHARRRALMVAFHFPPQAGSSGVLRTLNFVKYLPASRWQADVLTARAHAYEQTSSDLVASVPADTRIVRVACVDTARHLSLWRKYPLFLALPDRWASWWLPAVWRGMQQMRARQIDLIDRKSVV